MKFCFAIDRSFLLGLAFGVGLHITYIQAKYNEKQTEEAPS